MYLVPEPLRDIAERQRGILTRGQVVGAGLRDDFVEAQFDARRWQRVHRATYCVTTGVLTREQQLFAAVLSCGTGATLSHRTAAEIHGIFDGSTEPIHVTIPGGRRIVSPRGVRVHHAQRVDQTRHPVLTPARTRVADTVLDIVAAATTPLTAIDVVLRACQRRVTTPERLRDAVTRRKKLRWRAIVLAVVQEARHGVESPLELAYVNRVERPHGLPSGSRQTARRLDGLQRYRDVDYHPLPLLVELDGAAAHPLYDAHRDHLRDNLHAEHDGVLTLRYGWHAVAGDPCGVAAQVGRVLVQCGWTGQLRRCPSCPR